MTSPTFRATWTQTVMAALLCEESTYWRNASWWDDGTILAWVDGINLITLKKKQLCHVGPSGSLHWHFQHKSHSTCTTDPHSIIYSFITSWYDDMIKSLNQLKKQNDLILEIIFSAVVLTPASSVYCMNALVAGDNLISCSCLCSISVTPVFQRRAKNKCRFRGFPGGRE